VWDGERGIPTAENESTDHQLARAPPEYARVNGAVTCVPNMASSMGTAAGTDIPIEHLEYSYIEKCTKVKEIEKILRVLR